MGDGIGEGLKLAVGGLEFGGTLFNAGFEITASLIERCVAVLNLGEHGVKSVYKNSDFVTVGLEAGTDGIVLATRDKQGCVSQSNDGLCDQSSRDGADSQCGCHAEEQNHTDDEKALASSLTDLGEPGGDV